MKTPMAGKNGMFCSAVIDNNKATPAGHNAAAAGVRPGVPPLTPQSKILNRVRRSVTLKIRLTKEEQEKLISMLPSDRNRSRGISKFVRERLFSRNHSGSISSKATLHRDLAGVKSELHQIARLAHRIPNSVAVVEVLAYLASLEREIRGLTKGNIPKVLS